MKVLENKKYEKYSQVILENKFLFWKYKIVYRKYSHTFVRVYKSGHMKVQGLYGTLFLKNIFNITSD